jgi:hypothetical protein
VFTLIKPVHTDEPDAGEAPEVLAPGMISESLNGHTTRCGAIEACIGQVNCVSPIDLCLQQDWTKVTLKFA